MKHVINTNLYIFLITILLSCKSEDKPVKLVEEFVSTINSSDKELDTSAIRSTTDIKKYLFLYPTVNTKNWEFSSQLKGNGNTIVDVSSEASTVDGDEKKYVQSFEINKGILVDLRNFFILNNNYEVILKDWDILWDLEKISACEDIEKNIKMIPFSSQSSILYSDSRKGNIKIINNSKYDVKRLELQIEHFDSRGKPIKTDSEYSSGILRKNGAQIIKWYTINCDDCKTQKYKIVFKNDQY